MNTVELYRLIIKLGIKTDPRDEKQIKGCLSSVRARYNKLTPLEKRNFDREELTNPYNDTRILFGSPKKAIKNIMVGIDIDTQELLLVRALREKGKKIDLVLSHHPQGLARAEYYKVMGMQLDMLADLGIKGQRIKKLLKERMDEISRKTIVRNCTRPVDAARLLDIPFMCSHTPADNFAYRFIKGLAEKEGPEKVSDIFKILYKVPEYQLAMSNNQGPKLILGKPSNKCGKIYMEMTGGSEGPKNIFPEFVKKGIRTIIGMHMSEEHFKKAKRHKLNIIVAGHISSDTLGMNLMLDEIEKVQKLNVISCSGFKRIKERFYNYGR